MKLFSIFNTNIDIQHIQDAREYFDNNQILLIKKHPLYLIKTFPWYILLIITTGIFIWTMLQVEKENKWFEYMLIWIIIALILYRIIWIMTSYYRYSKFILHQKIYTIHLHHIKKAKNTKEFNKFIKKSLILWVLYIGCFILFEIEKIVRGYNHQLWISLTWGVMLLLILFCIYQTLLLHIHYELDFLIITPKYIEHVFQKNFFYKHNITIRASEIKSIDFTQKWIWKGLFNIWNITFIVDSWLQTKETYLRFNYISDASSTRKKILDIINANDNKKEKSYNSWKK